MVPVSLSHVEIKPIRPNTNFRSHNILKLLDKINGLLTYQLDPVLQGSFLQAPVAKVSFGWEYYQILSRSKRENKNAAIEEELN